MPATEDNVIETFSVYFANVYWNQLYNEAVNALTTYESLEDSYRATIDKFNVAVCRKNTPQEKDNSNYRAIMNNLRTYYATYIDEYSTYTEFIVNIIRILLPDEYKKLDNARCDAIFRKLITTSLTKFTMSIIQAGGGLNDIISEEGRRHPEIHQVTLKERFGDIFKTERNAFYSLVVAGRSGVNVAKVAEGLGSAATTNEAARQLIDKYHTKMQALFEEKADIIHKYNRMLEAIRQCNDIIKDKDQIILEKNNTISNLEEQLRRLRGIDVMTRPPPSAPVQKPEPRPVPQIVIKPSTPEPEEDSDDDIVPTNFDAEEEAHDIIDNL